MFTRSSVARGTTGLTKLADARPTPLTTRLTQITALLATNSVVRTKDLQERFGVSRRTVARDMKTIRAAGLRVAYDAKEGTFRLDGTDF